MVVGGCEYLVYLCCHPNWKAPLVPFHFILQDSSERFWQGRSSGHKLHYHLLIWQCLYPLRLEVSFARYKIIGWQSICPLFPWPTRFVTINLRIILMAPCMRAVNWCFPDSLVFGQFDYMMCLKVGLLSSSYFDVHWAPQMFLLTHFIKFGKLLVTILILLCSFFTFPSGTPTICMLVLLLMSHQPFKLCSLSFNLSFSDSIISISYFKFAHSFVFLLDSDLNAKSEFSILIIIL